MASLLEVAANPASGVSFFTETIELRTTQGGQMIDLTAEIEDLIAQSGIWRGIVNVQTMHTTTAIFINEHEPLLLEDLGRTLNRLIPQNDDYRHNDFAVRTVNMEPGEVPNGHSHCQSLLLNCAATLNIIDGRLKLGRWQRIFFIELDHERDRSISVLIMGENICGDHLGFGKQVY